MKFEFTDVLTGEQLIVVSSPNSAFASNIFNLFIVEMTNLHGYTFKKLSSKAITDDTGSYIDLIYTHNIVGRLYPTA